MRKRGTKDVRESERRYFNRELSWLEFNRRVLDEAFDSTNPLLERVKFFCIFNSNLDEFFEVRVAGLMEARQGGIRERSVDGLDASQTLDAIREQVRTLVDEAYRCWREILVPELSQHGIDFLNPERVPAEASQWLAHYYREKVSPVLTPLALDPAHPCRPRRGARRCARIACARRPACGAQLNAM